MKKRDTWSSNFGFIMAAAGSAIGLGNLWKFPYLVGKNGGAIFLIFYFIFIAILGIPILLSEMSIGRHTQLNAIDACGKINKKWKFVGAFGILGAFIILSYYSVVGGWVLKYLATYFTTSKIENTTEYFNNFVSKPVEPIIWHLVFMIITIGIVMVGVSKGIEKASKIMLPLLFIFIIGIAIKSLTLPGAIEGVKFFLVPDFSQINSYKDIANVIFQAMGQVFFSLSLGMGTLITYGSYLKNDTNLQKSAITIPLLDSLIAILAGFAILPAVFSFGLEPTAGPGLIFQTLPIVFGEMKAGFIIAIIFFLLVFFAAITSAISLLEVVTAFFIDNKKWSRMKATIVPGVIMFLIGCFASLSFGKLGNIKILGQSIFDFMTFVSDKLLMPLGGFFMCILVGYIWGIKNISNEITNQGQLRFRLEKAFAITIKFIAPALILIIFISSFI